MKLLICLLLLLFSCGRAFSQSDTIPKNESKEYTVAYKQLVGWWYFESKTCITGTDTTTETSTYGRGRSNTRPHTYLEFNRNGELFVHSENYPQLSRMKRKPMISYIAEWRIEQRAFDTAKKPYLNIYWNSANGMKCEFTGVIKIEENKIEITNTENCLIKLKKHSGKF